MFTLPALLCAGDNAKCRTSLTRAYRASGGVNHRGPRPTARAKVLPDHMRRLQKAQKNGECKLSVERTCGEPLRFTPHSLFPLPS